MILKGDQDPAIIELQRAHMKCIRGMEDELELPPVVLDNSTVGDSEANGAAEGAI